MTKQLFHHLRTIQPYSGWPANICLSYDTVKHLHPYGEARTAYVDWEQDIVNAARQPYPEILTFLYPAPINGGAPIMELEGPEAPDAPTPQPFAVYPNFPRSVISRHIADLFHLHLTPIGYGGIIPPPCRIPFDKLFYDVINPIPAQFLALASLEMSCSSRINPTPYPERHHFQFLVLDNDWVPNRLAIIGRDILNHMLLVYRGHANRSALPGTTPQGRLYFGCDTGEPEHVAD